MVDPIRNPSAATTPASTASDPAAVSPQRKDRFSGAMAAAISRAAKPVYDSGVEGEDPDPQPIPASAPVMIPGKGKKAV